MKIYICGPTNQELRETLELFHRWEIRLRLEIPKADVINPTTIDTNMAWGDYEAERLNELQSSDIVFILHGWNDSQIARKEFLEATKMYIPVYFEYQIEDLVEHCNQDIILNRVIH